MTLLAATDPMPRMVKRGLSISWVVVVVLSCLVSTAFAGPPVEVCWKPLDLPPESTKFVVIVDKKGARWTVVNQDEFRRETANRTEYHYNPNLGPETLARLPPYLRALACTPPPNKPNAPKTKAPAPPPPPPAPPPPPPPPKEDKKDDDAKEKPEEKKEETPEEPGPDSYEGFHERNLRNPGLLPLCGTIKRDKEHPRPKECPASYLQFADENPALPNEQEGGVLGQESAFGTTAPCEEIKGGCLDEEGKKTGDEKGPIEKRTMGGGGAERAGAIHRHREFAAR